MLDMEMKLYDIDFAKLEKTRKQCVTFAKDGNSVVKPYRTFCNVKQITGNEKHKKLYLEIVNEKETWEAFKLYLWEDLGSICNKIDRLPENWTIEHFSDMVEKYEYFGEKGLLKRLENSENNRWYINLLDIQLCLSIGRIDLARHYAAYREELIKEREQAEKKSRETQERIEKEMEERRQAEINEIIKEAEERIFHQEDVLNEKIDGTSVINLLMRKHGINVPLRTQGWINTKLAKIIFENGEITYKFYGKSKRDNSTVFREYLEKLNNAIEDSFAIPFF